MNQREVVRQSIARVAHEANRAYCVALGDLTNPSWEDAPQWQKESTLAGVDMHLALEGTDPQDSHENWLKGKIEAGWTWGPKKAPHLKQHPCLVPFDELPVEQQAKDYIFCAIVKALATPAVRELVNMKEFEVQT